MREAGYWIAKRFRLLVDNFGVQHIESLKLCMALGFLYAKQGLFDEAVLHFQQTVALIEDLHGNEAGEGHEGIRRIQEWVATVEEMRQRRAV